MKLEDKFNKVMWGIADEIQEVFHTVPTRFLQMLSKYDGVGTAKRLLATKEPGSGFTSLAESGRYDLSAEYYVIKPEYKTLFTDEERHVARDRLIAYGYKIQQESE